MQVPLTWTSEAKNNRVLGSGANVESSVILGMAGKFVSKSGEILADLKRRDIATIDADLLKLKREKMSEALEQLRVDVGKASEEKKG